MYFISMYDDCYPLNGKVYLFEQIDMPTERDIMKGGCVNPVLFKFKIYDENGKDTTCCGFKTKEGCEKMIEKLEKIQSFKTLKPRYDWKFKPIRLGLNSTIKLSLSDKELELFKQSIEENEEIVLKRRKEFKK